MANHPSKRETWLYIDGTTPTLVEYARAIWEFRELFRLFIARDLAVRYKQALLGATWVLLKPLLTMLLFTFVFSTVAHFPLPPPLESYPLFVLAAMLPWQLFANCLVDASATMGNHALLMDKAYFPRVLLPLSLVLVQWVDFAISLLLFGLLALWMGMAPPLLALLFFPLLILWTLLLCWGAALWLAPLGGIYHDVRFLVTFLVQLGLFLSPVGYGSWLIPEPWQLVYSLNPLVGLIDGYRYLLLGVEGPHLVQTACLSFLEASLLFISGLYFHKKIDRHLVDLI